MPRIVIVSGLSGSGKSLALKSFEDMGYYCVDNLPTALALKFAELCSQSDKGITRAALGIDIREKDLVDSFGSLQDSMKAAGYDIRVLFLEASDEALVRRFSETRRPHPLAKDKPLPEAIRLERAMMDEIKKRADEIIDTSSLTVHQLRDEIMRRYGPGAKGRPLTISVMSFGFKYGVPYDADTVFDVRFLPNPNFVPSLKPLTGRDKEVQEFIGKKDGIRPFMRKVMGLLDYLIPLYAKEGKTYLTIAVGCTGGRHRSVAVAELLGKRLKGKGLEITTRHRDVDR